MKIKGRTQGFCSAGAIPYLGVCLFFFAFGAAKGGKNSIALVGTMVMSYLHLRDQLDLQSS
jgi:hypothetical protein